MDFSGEKYATVDEKGRVVLPADFKNEMGGNIPGGQLAIERDPYERCLNIFTMETWEKRLAQLKANLDPNDRDDSRLLDYIYRSFKVIQVPDNCRINLPTVFMEKVNIKKEVVFIGRGDRIRLWDVDEFKTYEGSDDDYGKLFGRRFGKKEG